jgi:hypothetical protein
VVTGRTCPGCQPNVGRYDDSQRHEAHGHPAHRAQGQRADIEVLFDELPEPIDLELDPRSRMIYWTDRGDPPRGNTVNRAPMDPTPGRRKDPEIVFAHLTEGIGLALDLKGDRMFFADFGGTVYRARLDGSETTVLVWAEGNLTGVAYAELPAKARLVLIWTQKCHAFAVVADKPRGLGNAQIWHCLSPRKVATSSSPRRSSGDVGSKPA